MTKFLREKEVPVGAHPLFWYFLGGATLFFFTIQLVTGMLLLMYYQPGEATSYESILYLTTKVPFGWLIRSMHCWSAHLMIVSLVVHMFSTMMLKAYRPPRELTWVTGYLLFALALGFGFSGYLLPWNELAFFATSVGTDSVKSVPLVGDWLLNVMRGGPEVTINTLYRFFALHVAILPIISAGLIGGHLLFIQRQGMALPVGESKAPRGLKFFPNFALRDLLLWLICLIALLVLSLVLPYGAGIPGVEWELGLKADPLAPAYPGIKPEWYFLWVYQLLKEFPPHLLG
ncbi:MAG: cytochrome b N-terminal domain-containing protein, partial [Deltaproteobacteria bacterium]|nr:cytochrome b N-terminal domain-containing protein [Deltaproteobacteria bacterium]